MRILVVLILIGLRDNTVQSASHGIHAYHKVSALRGAFGNWPANGHGFLKRRVWYQNDRSAVKGVSAKIGFRKVKVARWERQGQ